MNSKDYEDPGYCNDCTWPKDKCVCVTVEQPRPTLRDQMLTRSALTKLPKPDPIIRGTLETRKTAMLAGYWASAKSFVALSWAACIATGQPWFGRPVEQGRVVYIAAEGAYGLDDRLTAWECAWQIDIPDDAFYVIDKPIQVANPAERRELEAVIADIGASLTVVDTVARCALGLDENSARDMGTFVHALDQLRDAADDHTVLAVHHTGKDKSTVRGSSVLESSIDTLYKVEADDQGGYRLWRDKMKDGPRNDEMRLRLAQHSGLPSVVLEATKNVHSGADIPGRAEELLSVVSTHFSQTGCTKNELRLAANMPNGTFARSLNRLMDQRLLANTGTDKRPFYVLANPGDQP